MLNFRQIVTKFFRDFSNFSKTKHTANVCWAVPQAGRFSETFTGFCTCPVCPFLASSCARPAAALRDRHCLIRQHRLNGQPEPSANCIFSDGPEDVSPKTVVRQNLLLNINICPKVPDLPDDIRGRVRIATEPGLFFESLRVVREEGHVSGYLPTCPLVRSILQNILICLEFF